MRLPQPFINKAFELHDALVESYKTLNKNLTNDALSDIERVLSYDAHFSRCIVIKAIVKETIDSLNETEASCYFYFFKKSKAPIEYFLSIVYDEKYFIAQEKIRQGHDPFIKIMPTPTALYFNPHSYLYFRNRNSLMVNNENKSFTTLFQKLIEKNRDFLLEEEMLKKLTQAQNEHERVDIIKKTPFRHPLFLNKYRQWISEAPSENCTPR